MPTNNTNPVKLSPGGFQSNVRTEDASSNLSPAYSTPEKTKSSTATSSSSVNRSTQVDGYGREMVYEMDSNGIQPGSPKIIKQLSRSSVYPSGTNLTARDAFGEFQIHHSSMCFRVSGETREEVVYPLPMMFSPYTPLSFSRSK